MNYLLHALFYFKQLKFPLLLSALLYGLSALCKTLYALRLSDFLDGAVGAAGIMPRQLLWVFALLAAYLLLFYLAERVFGELMLRGGYLLQAKNTEKLFNISLGAGLSQGELLSRTARDSGDFRDAVAGLLRGSLFSALTMLIMLIVLCQVCWPLAMTAFLLPVAYNFCVLRISGGRQREQEEERRTLGSLADYTEDCLANQAEIRFGRLENAADTRHRKLLGQWEAIRRVLSRFWSLVGAFDTLFYLGYRLALLLLGLFFVRRSAMTYGDIFTFLTLSGAFTGFVWDFRAEAYREAIAAARRLLDFWEMPEERTGGAPLPWIGETYIRAQALSFSYDKAHPVLEKASFSLQKGEAMGLVGESGSGKTTLLGLICGFFEAQEGTLEIGGADVNRWQLLTLRRRMAYLQQDTALIRGTIAENIAFREEADIGPEDRARIAEILADVGLGYLADCGSGEDAARRTAGLSQGELQRVGLARCLFKGADIWLLDEPTSALDAETEAGIAALLQKFRQRGITILAITHRRGILRGFDRVAALEKGHIVPVFSLDGESLI